MMAALHIFWREFKSYFYSPVAYFGMLGFLLFNGFIFWWILSWIASEPTIPATFEPLTILMASIIFMVSSAGFIPMITMRVFAEERRSGSIELLLTAPVRDFEVVLGKFLAAWAFYLLLWVPTLLYLGVMLMYLDVAPDLGPVYASYIGVALMSFGFVAVGVMFSSFTKNQMLALGLTFAFLVIIFFLGIAADKVPNKLLQDVCSYIGTYGYMNDFAKGIVDLKAVVYCLSMGFLSLFIATRSLEARKWR